MELKNLMSMFFIVQEASLFLKEPVKNMKTADSGRYVTESQIRRFIDFRGHFNQLVEKYRLRLMKLEKTGKGRIRNFDIVKTLYLASMWHPESVASNKYDQRIDKSRDKDWGRFKTAAMNFYVINKIKFTSLT